MGGPSPGLPISLALHPAARQPIHARGARCLGRQQEGGSSSGLASATARGSGTSHSFWALAQGYPSPGPSDLGLPPQSEVKHATAPALSPRAGTAWLEQQARSCPAGPFAGQSSFYPPTNTQAPHPKCPPPRSVTQATRIYEAPTMHWHGGPGDPRGGIHVPDQVSTASTVVRVDTAVAQSQTK